MRWFRSIDPQVRVEWAARNFWLSIVFGTLATTFIARTGFERVLMAISWLAITYTCVDIIVGTDIRAEG